ncbi:hypothetical protein CYMTET_18624, partial [Cymbomonas tetramitiformis]
WDSGARYMIGKARKAAHAAAREGYMPLAGLREYTPEERTELTQLPLTVAPKIALLVNGASPVPPHLTHELEAQGWEYYPLGDVRALGTQPPPPLWIFDLFLSLCHPKQVVIMLQSQGSLALVTPKEFLVDYQKMQAMYATHRKKKANDPDKIFFGARPLGVQKRGDPYKETHPPRWAPLVPPAPLRPSPPLPQIPPPRPPPLPPPLPDVPPGHIRVAMPPKPRLLWPPRPPAPAFPVTASEVQTELEKQWKQVRIADEQGQHRRRRHKGNQSSLPSPPPDEEVEDALDREIHRKGWISAALQRRGYFKAKVDTPRAAGRRSLLSKKRRNDEASYVASIPCFWGKMPTNCSFVWAMEALEIGKQHDLLRSAQSRARNNVHLDSNMAAGNAQAMSLAVQHAVLRPDAPAEAMLEDYWISSEGVVLDYNGVLFASITGTRIEDASCAMHVTAGVQSGPKLCHNHTGGCPAFMHSAFGVSQCVSGVHTLWNQQTTCGSEGRKYGKPSLAE